MNRKSRFAFLIFALVMSTSWRAAHAQANLRAGIQLSLLGPGLSADLEFGRIAISGEFGLVPIRSIAFTEEDIDFLVNTDFYGGLVMLNFRPSSGKLSLDFGAFFGGYKADGSAKNIDQQVLIGNHIYQADDLGDLLADIDFDGPAPALMVGLRGRGLNIGVGVALTGKPQFNLDATGPIKDDPEFLEDAVLQADNIERDVLSKIPAMPLFRLGWLFGG